jgi:ABC-2 type transport system ATP-binding protein
LAVIDQGRLIACDTREALEERVGGDIVTIEAEDAAALAKEIAEQLGPEVHVVRVSDGELVFMAARAHEQIPRLVERLPRGRLRSIAMRRPSLGDVFMHLTGRGLEGSLPAPVVL